MSHVRKVLFFSPFAFTWAQIVPEFQLAQLLHAEGFQVKVIGCRRSYSTRCTSMEVARLPTDANEREREKVCKKCISNSRLLAESFSEIQFSPIEAYSDDRNTSSNLAPEIPKTPEEILGYSRDGIKLGRLALYETVIKFKKFNVELNPIERRYFEMFFLSALKVLDQAATALRTEKPDVVICYSPQYVIPGIFAAVAAREGIRTIFIEGSSNDMERHSHLRMWDWKTHGLNQPALAVPERFESFKLTTSGTARAKRLMEVRQNASAHSAYTSAAKNASPFDVFHLDKNKKYIVLAMSSYDEVFSGYVIEKLPRARFEGRVFKNQIEWLRETIAWISSHAELQLVIRPHPREFPNKWENSFSPHVKEWTSVLASLPPNVKVDPPDLKFSLYDHLAHADVLITGWSSVGVEALSKGVPVVTYDEELPPFPKSIHYSGTSKSEYFKNIFLACQDIDRNRHIENATKWLAYTSEVGTIETGGRLDDRFKILAKLNIRGLLRQRLPRRLDLFFPPSKRDIKRLLDLVQGKGTSLFDLPK